MMKIAFLGDSITLGYALEDKQQRFTTLICRKLACEELNFGITGTLMAQAGLNRLDKKDYVTRAPLVKDADVAVVFGGTNDYFWSDHAIAPAVKDSSSKSVEYFTYALEAICEYCQAVRRSKTTLFVTPYPHHGTGNYLGGVAWNASSTHDTSEKNFNGHILQDYVDEIEHIASRYGFPVLNLHKVGGFDWKIHTIDGCHPNAAGHQWLAEKIESCM